MTEAKRPGRPPGSAKTGGRQKGSLDKEQRQLIGSKLMADVMRAYKKQGPDYLAKFATEQPRDFIALLLTRLMPQPLKEQPDVSITNQTLNIDATSEFEAARRVAYLLANAAAKLDLPPEPVRQVDQDPLPRRLDPVVEATPERHPEPEGPEHYGFAHYAGGYDQWCADLRKTDTERAQEAEIHGSSIEQGVGGLRSGVSTEPPTTVAGRLRGRRR